MAEKQYEAVRRQLQQEFLSSADFLKKSDRDRQIEFELYAILGAMIDGMNTELNSVPDEGKRTQLRKLASESFTSLMGVPPERVELSSGGYYRTR